MMATVSLALVEELVSIHRKASIACLAAPVFGVPALAAQAKLNILVAGDVAKIAGNTMISLAIEAMGEATALIES